MGQTWRSSASRAAGAATPSPALRNFEFIEYRLVAVVAVCSSLQRLVSGNSSIRQPSNGPARLLRKQISSSRWDPPCPFIRPLHFRYSVRLEVFHTSLSIAG